MKKYLLSIIVLLIALFPLTFVKAKSIEQVIVYQDFKDIIVKGETSEDILAVSLEVYDEDETELVKKLTAYVNDDNTFKVTIDVPNGKYTLKVADYDGGDYETLSFNKEDPYAGTTPDTSDNIYSYIIVGTLSLISLAGTLAIRKRLN